MSKAQGWGLITLFLHTFNILYISALTMVANFVKTYIKSQHCDYFDTFVV